MAETSLPGWRRYLLPGAVTVLCLFLAHGVITTGIAAAFENADDGARALAWRPRSPVALALKAENLGRNGDRADADRIARQAIERSSLRVNALSVLGLSASFGRRPEEAQILMERAGHLNPRDGEVQAWLLERAIARADYPGAVLHADALMRLNPATWAPLSFVLADLLGDARARAALVQRLSLNPPWRATFLSVAVRAGADADVAALFAALRRAPSPLTDDEASSFFQRLVSNERYREAKAYFDALVGRAGGNASLVYDGNFAGRAGPTPFNWQAMSILGGNARWKQDNGAPLGALHLTHDGFSSSDPMVRQLILLTAGDYEIAARSRIDDPLAARRFKLQVVCINGERLVSILLPGTPGAWTPSRAGFSVPPEACAAQWLQIAPETLDRHEVAEMTIDDIVVRRVARAEKPVVDRISPP